MRIKIGKGIQLGPLSFYREALRIALPVMLQQLIMSMVSLIDNFMVAGLGDLSMASVNLANQVNFIYIVIINCICAAGGIYLAQFNGAGNADGMKHAFRFKMLLSTAVSALYFALCQTIPENMIAVMTMGNSAQAEIVMHGADYLRFTSFTLVPIAISTSIGSAFREMGIPKIPLFISIAATIVNTLGNWLLIYGNFGAPRLEIRGAAIATIIARAVEVTLFLWYVQRKKMPFFVGLTQLFAVNKKLIVEILSKSWMMFLSELSWVGSETIMTALYNGRGGAEVVAGMQAGWTIANIFFLLFGGIFTSTTVIIGGALGAGKLNEVRAKAEWIKSGSTIAGAAISVVGIFVAFLLIPIAFGNLTDDARAISMGLIGVILVYFPLWSLLNSLWAISRAGGDTAMGMWADVLVNSLLFVPGAFLLAFFTDLPPVPLFAILKLTDIAKFFVANHLLKKERWIKNLTQGT